ncbi:tetratricopeptide repeat protein [Devosia faecipullorum]|uniref:tetratricopeptide repeat protein n=1 Tax=Devosia faecipullorum TaxID=2755039 RepID=UPI00187B1900|nr:tetratricopeptide repeat protein [Devosia faecipullorum]MBE7731960.1 sel1 repeat family protein [Devosia faecipullorum]
MRIVSMIAALALSTTAYGQTATLPPDNGLYEEMYGEALVTVRAEADTGNAGAAFALARGLLAGEPDPSEALEGAKYLEIAADAGIVDAQVQFANLVRRGGHGAPPDAQRALDLLEKAAKTGDASAVLTLGSFVLDTQLGAAGRDRALDLLQNSADAGNINAANLLGGLYLQGRGVPIDPERALEYFEMGLIVGNTPAMVSMGDLYRSGASGIAPDPGKALALYNHAGTLGYAVASRRVADMYLNGEGVSASPETAIGMLEEQAGKGDPQAYLALADYNLRGEIIPVNLTNALAYLEKAVASGNATALLRLGDLYRLGAVGLAPDPGKALEYYNRAIELGAPGAERYAGNLYLDLNQPFASPSRGIELLKTAASKGDATAAIRLGDLYSVNDLVQADYDTSKAYFEMALGFGNSNAILDLAQALVSGPLAVAHRDEALNLLTGAVESGLPGASAELARLQLAGTFPGRGLDGVLSMLLDGARNGDAAAARYLLQLYREGYGLVVQPDHEAAENLLASLEPVLGAEGVAVERIYLAAPDGPIVDNLQAIDAEFSKLKRGFGVQVLRHLRTSNAHAYVYIVQKRLKERGMYSGPLHGMLDTATIGAMRTACEQVGAERTCDAGPLTDGAVQVLANYLFDPAVSAVETES